MVLPQRPGYVFLNTASCAKPQRRGDLEWEREEFRRSEERLEPPGNAAQRPRMLLLRMADESLTVSARYPDKFKPLMIQRTVASL